MTQGLFRKLHIPTSFLINRKSKTNFYSRLKIDLHFYHYCTSSYHILMYEAAIKYAHFGSIHHAWLSVTRRRRAICQIGNESSKEVAVRSSMKIQESLCDIMVSRIMVSYE